MASRGSHLDVLGAASSSGSFPAPVPFALLQHAESWLQTKRLRPSFDSGLPLHPKWREFTDARELGCPSLNVRSFPKKFALD